MSTKSPAEFQRAAIEHITERLRDPAGSRRFLLADEVGLGKTIVARGVIENLAARKKEPLRVIYLCSNVEIAEQNRTKLDPGAGQPVGRVTELALGAGRRSREIHLYSFTPGTSLREGTGLAWERRLLLYLLRRLYNAPVHRKAWREYFRCTAGEAGWVESTRWSVLCSEFERKTTGEFQAELRSAWHVAFGRGHLRDLELAVMAFEDGDATSRSDRNAKIAEMRGVMQRIALRSLRPDLVILDEVQRFRTVLDEAEQENSLASELFRERNPVLILSATPYRLLTLDAEVEVLGGSHHEDFFQALGFLFDRDREAPDRIRKGLKEFGAALRTTDLTGARDDQLLAIKRSVENELRRVICRTERNWYLLDASHGVRERLPEKGDLPRTAELEEYFRLRSGLGSHLDGTAQVTEFWKSAPSILTFMDAGYALLRRLRDGKVVVPPRLLTGADDVHALAERNQRMRRAVSLALGDAAAPPRLWAKPTYCYYRDRFFGQDSPRKLLVFSGWRFVPKAVAIVMSGVAAQRLATRSDGSETQPLRFSERRSFHIFDVCMPSPALADALNPRAPRDGLKLGEMDAGEWLASAERNLRVRLADAGVRVGASGNAAVWRVIARLERRAGNMPALKRALNGLTGHDAEEPSDAVVQHREWFAEWLDDDHTELVLSEARFRHLLLVAASSPAVSLTRALESVYGPIDPSTLARLTRLCLGAMRRYFNRPLVQQAVRAHIPLVNWPTRSGGMLGYAERVLLYALDAHLQAVFDEHAYLLRHSAQCDTVEKAIEQVEAVWSLSQGSPRTNGASRARGGARIDADAHTHAAQFALAFGDDVTRDAGPAEEQGGRLRKTVVREAFNSPFWPFVLATTSVGQEGLDFHLYCRDIMHWNLPSNPVDMEQREGRINRRDCLAVRESIARDVPIADVRSALDDRYKNPWAAVFSKLEKTNHFQQYKHGLFPHWLYECADPERTVGIERHIAYFESSRDAKQYERLKVGLTLYRLVFGQPNQEHLLEELEQRLGELGKAERERALRRLAGYMLNLSPVTTERVRQFAENEAAQMLAARDAAALQRLIDDVQRLRVERAAELDTVSADLDKLVEYAFRALEMPHADGGAGRLAVMALAYLRNPFDGIFDTDIDCGLDDDLSVIREAAKTIS